MAAERLRPLAEAGAPGRVNRELIKAMGDLGLLAEAGRDAESREAAATEPAPAQGVAGDRQHRGGNRARAAGPGRLPDPAVRAPGRR